MESAYIQSIRAMLEQAIEITRPSILRLIETQTTGGRNGLWVVCAHKIDVSDSSLETFARSVLVSQTVCGLKEPRQTWKHNFDEMAQKKTFVAWRNEMEDADVHLRYPYLLRPGDPKFYGATWVPKIAIGCSGFQMYMDLIASRMVAQAFLALSQRMLEVEVTEFPEKSFIR